jgi:hypothetical protein
MAQCGDETFYYQPNRDNAGYGSDARLTASSVTAFMLLLPKRSLVMTGKPPIEARSAEPAAPAVSNPPSDDAVKRPSGETS